MSSPILWGPSNIASNLQGSLINSDTSINKYDGVQNYILNSHAELNTTGWATYADAAQATPVNGTGGSPTVTWTQTTTAPLDGGGSFVFTKDAANRQGEGASYDFTIDSASQAKVMTITCDYIIGSGTFVAGSKTVDSDIEIYIYDVTNSVLIQPSTYKLYSNSSTVPTQFIANFQTSYNSTSYRLIFHCATTSASAYTVKFDNVKVSPTQYTYGTPITDWTSYTPTFSNFGTCTNVSFKWRRVGTNVEISGTATSGTPVTSLATITMPYSYTVNTTLITTNTAVGPLVTNHSGSVAANCLVTTTSGNLIYFSIVGDAGGSLNADNGNSLVTTTDNFSVFASVPILGWSSCVQMSDQTTQQVVDFVGYVGVNQALTVDVTNMTLIALKDSTGSWTGSTYVVPVSGDYLCGGASAMTTNSSSASIDVWVNGVDKGRISNSIGVQSMAGGSILLNDLKAGDVISFRAHNSAFTTLADTTFKFYIQRLAGPSSIAATDTVAAFYYASANVTGTSSTPFNFDSKVYDYTGSTVVGSGWKFTAPVAGLYTVTIYTNGSTSPDYIRLYKSGSFYMPLGYGPTNSISTLTGDIKLNAGEYIDFRAASTLTINGGSLAVNTTSWCTIKKTGTF